jgi:tRNA A37 threonylcarbamoyladenosine modification protein TsaB
LSVLVYNSSSNITDIKSQSKPERDISKRAIAYQLHQSPASGERQSANMAEFFISARTPLFRLKPGGSKIIFLYVLITMKQRLFKLEYSAAIDLSGNEAAFAAVCKESGNIEISNTRPMTGRNSAALTPWMLELINARGIQLEHIAEWTVGSGPGSFTGMRLAAALVAGIAFGNANIKTRCVPTAVALASALKTSPGDSIAAVFDGRNCEILIFELVNQDGAIIPAGKNDVLSARDANAFFNDRKFNHLIALEKDRAAIAKVIDANMMERFKLIEHISPENLIFAQCAEWNNDLTDLVYIRPAVFTGPATI